MDGDVIREWRVRAFGRDVMELNGLGLSGHECGDGCGEGVELNLDVIGCFLRLGERLLSFEMKQGDRTAESGRVLAGALFFVLCKRDHSLKGEIDALLTSFLSFLVNDVTGLFTYNVPEGLARFN